MINMMMIKKNVEVDLSLYHGRGLTPKVNETKYWRQ